MPKFNVLVFPAGEINSVELHTALSSNVNINLFGASSIDRHGPFVFKNYISGLPMITDDGFVEALNKIIDENTIDLIIPTHDTVALYFAEHNQEISTKVLTPDHETAKICRSKKETYARFEDCSFLPRVYRAEEQLDFPLFIKPDKSEGGKGTKFIRSKAELLEVDRLEDYVISEYLPGEELTVDCITDHKGDLKGVFPRTRQRTYCGVSVAGKALPATPDIMEIASVINTRLKFLGMWFFQLKKDKQGEYKLMEVATRVPCGMCLTRARGVNLPLLSVYAAMGLDIEVFSNNYAIQMDRTLTNRYFTDLNYEHVYLDFDDTLINEDIVNLDVIRFLYQCMNKGKKVYLLTKHELDIQESLQHFHIDPTLFHEILQIPVDDEKYKYIQPNGAIFIDNAYRERQAVMIKCGIPVFDIDTIEVLLDWRK